MVLRSVIVALRKQRQDQLQRHRLIIIRAIIHLLCHLFPSHNSWAWWVVKTESSTLWCLHNQTKINQKVVNLAHVSNVNLCTTSLKLWWTPSKKLKICCSETNYQLLQKVNDQCQTTSTTTVQFQTSKERLVKCLKISLITAVRSFKT